MRSNPLLLTPLAVVVRSSMAGAQIVDPGLVWIGASGTFAGTACGGFTCTPHTTTVSVNEVATVQVRGTVGTAFAIGLSSSATQCLPVPPLQNSLVIDFPITIAVSGIFVDFDPILICAGGRASFTFTFPFLPSGTVLAIQAVAQLPDLTFSLTSAIQVTVL